MRPSIKRKRKLRARDGTVKARCWHSSFSEGLKPARGSPQSSQHACEDVGLGHCLNVREAEAQRSAACQQMGGNAERMLISFALGLSELLHDAGGDIRGVEVTTEKPTVTFLMHSAVCGKRLAW